jgi:hypothetical protein
MADCGRCRAARLQNRIADPLEVRSTGDPTDVAFSPHGVSMSAVDGLKAPGVNVETAPDANSVRPERYRYPDVGGLHASPVPAGAQEAMERLLHPWRRPPTSWELRDGGGLGLCCEPRRRARYAGRPTVR